MAAIDDDSCTPTDKAQPAAPLGTRPKYEPDCGQNSRPGRWWDPVRYRDKDRPGVMYDEENEKYYRWDRRGIQEPFSNTPNPRGQLGLYKNYKGCTLYKAKKDSCGRLHPNSGPALHTIVNKTDKNALNNLISKYETCINNYKKMNKCVRRGIDPEGDKSHDRELGHREEELKNLRRFLDKLKQKERKKREDNATKLEADRLAQLNKDLRKPISELSRTDPNTHKLIVVIPLNENASAKAHLERLTLVPGLALDGEFTELTAIKNNKLQGMGAVLKAAIKKLLIRYILNGNQGGTDWKRKIEEAKEMQRFAQLQAENRDGQPELMDNLTIDEIISAAPSGKFGIEGREFSETMMAAADAAAERGVEPRWFYHGGQDKIKKTLKKKIKNKKTKKSKKKKQKMKKRTKKNKQKH